jgi:hypothetical protein
LIGVDLVIVLIVVDPYTTIYIVLVDPYTTIYIVLVDPYTTITIYIVLIIVVDPWSGGKLMQGGLYQNYHSFWGDGVRRSFVYPTTSELLPAKALEKDKE